MEEIKKLEKIIDSINSKDLNEKEIELLYENTLVLLENIKEQQKLVEYSFDQGITKNVTKHISNTLKYVLDNYPEKYSLVLNISNLLASFDRNIIRFSVDAAIIDRLGKELVGKRETAVSELVKNSYDADSSYVDLIFKDADNVGGTLIIEDNGTGMSKRELVEGFMRLSTRSKKNNPKSLIYNRTRAGKKGIGRFSTQRLGEHLTIITQTKDSDIALKMNIKWDDFDSDKDIFLLENKIEYIKKDKDCGTTLYIHDLRDKWTKAQIERVYRYVSESDLLQPFPLSEIEKGESLDPGFKVSCYQQKEANKKIPIANENLVFFKHSLAEFDAYVNKDGYAVCNISSRKLEYKEENIILDNKKYKYLSNVRIKAYYYIYNSGLIPKKTETTLKKTASEFGGIRLYRNGFRVLPYAEPDNDWLKLDASTVKRTVLPTHRNINFFGFIEVIDENDELFEEQSNREGLVDNDALEELKIFAYEVIISFVNKVGHLRGIKLKTNQKEWANQKPKEKLETINDKLSNLEKDVESEEVDVAKVKEEISNIKDEVTDVIVTQDEEEQKIIDELNMLRVLAGLGLIIGEFVHEIKFFQSTFHANVDTLMEKLKGESLEIVKDLKSNFNYFDTYRAYFDDTISNNVERSLKPLELKDIVRVFFKAIKKDVERNKVNFSDIICEEKFEYIDLYTCPMHESEWASILFNFYSNSKKAIKKANVEGQIDIEVGVFQDYVFLEFSDNGIGIKDKDKDSIFDQFFTTYASSSQNKNFYEDNTGTGLGLKITKDIVDSYGGKIYVRDPKENYSTTIRIEIPKLNKEQE